MDAGEPGAGAPRMRLDRWLWVARVFRTRSLAASACAGGKVRVNGDPAKAHRLVGAGDVVAVSTPAGPRVLAITGTAQRRGSAAVARQLYEDRTPAAAPADTAAPVAARAGRPTKRDRRELRRLRGR